MLNYRIHNLWRAFVDFLFGNDEKVASSQKHTHIKARLQIPYPIYDVTKMAKISYRYPIYDQNGWKTIPFGATHTYIAHIREYPRAEM